MNRRAVPLQSIMLYFIHRAGGWVDCARAQVFVLIVDTAFLRHDGRTLIDFGGATMSKALDDLCNLDTLLVDREDPSGPRFRVNPDSPMFDKNTGYISHVDSYMAQGTLAILSGIYDAFDSTPLPATLDRLHAILVERVAARERRE